MALSGLHIACGFIGEGVHTLHAYPIFSPVWSETIASAGTSTQAAPTGPGRPALQLYASAACYVAVGAAPDSSKAVSTDQQEARVFVPATTLVTIYCNDGDLVDWTAA